MYLHSRMPDFDPTEALIDLADRYDFSPENVSTAEGIAELSAFLHRRLREIHRDRHALEAIVKGYPSWAMIYSPPGKIVSRWLGDPLTPEDVQMWQQLALDAVERTLL